MNQIPNHLSSRSGQTDTPISYRPAFLKLTDKVRTPAKVASAVLGAAALGYLALMNQRRLRAKRLPSLKQAARNLAAHLPGMSSSTRPTKRKRSEEAPSVPNKPGIQKDSWRQIMTMGKSLMALFNAFAAFKAAQVHLDPVPGPDAALPTTPTTIPIKPDAPTSPAASSAFKPIPKGSLPVRAWHLIKAAVISWVDDFAPSMGAALSYYTVFSLAPMLLIIIGIAGLVFGAEAARGEIVGQLRGLMGEESAVAIEELLKSASDPGKGVVATIIGFVTLLIGATAVFAELQSSLDRIWRTPAPANENGIWGIIRTRFLSFGMILGLGFLMIVSLVLSAALAALGNWWGGFLGDWEFVLHAINFVVSFGVVTVVFAAIYKFMPHAEIEWPNVWVGAIVTALLFTIGKFLISLYIGKSGVASGFGAAGSFAVLLVWVYYSAQIFLLGAEFTWVYTHRDTPPPKAAQVPVQNNARITVQKSTLEATLS